MIKYFNQDKWERAKKVVGSIASEGEILTAYRNLGGAYETIADPFPAYLFRLQSSDTGDGNDPTITVYANLSAF